MQIVPAQPDLAPTLSRLAQASKAHWGYPQAWLLEWKEQLTLTEDEIRNGLVFVAQDEEIAGFYAITVQRGRAEVEHFWVAPAHMGCGVGRALFADLRRRALDLGAQTVDIDSDPNAEEFYLRQGAKRTGRTPAPVAGEERFLPRLSLQLTTIPR